MDAVGIVEGEVADAELPGQRQALQDDDALAGRGLLEDLPAIVVVDERLEDGRLVRGQVLLFEPGTEAAAKLDDGVGDRATIVSIHTLARKQVQRASDVGLAEGGAGGGGSPIEEELVAEVRLIVAVGGLDESAGQSAGDFEAVPGAGDGGLEEGGQRQAAPAAVCGQPRVDLARHGGAADATQGNARGKVFQASGEGRGAAAVEGGDLFVGGGVVEQEGVAAEVGVVRFNDVEHRAGREGGIDAIAACAEHPDAGLTRARVGGADDAAARGGVTRVLVHREPLSDRAGCTL
jgi:hypothetical protein